MTTPSIWVILVAVILLLAGILAWAAVGTLETKVEVTVIVDEHTALVVPLGGDVLSEGMTLRVAGGASSCPPNLRRKIDSLIDMDMDSDADDNRCSKAPKYFDKIFDDGTDIVKKCRPATTKSPL